MILAAILVALSWDAATLDCVGGLESPVLYHVLTSEIVITGEVMGEDGTLYPLYARTSWAQVAATPDTFITLNVPTPPVGHITLIDIEATDEAGNSSLACQ